MVSDLLLTHLKNIIKQKVQGQTLGSELIWVLFLNKHGKKLKYKTMILYINILEIIPISSQLGKRGWSQLGQISRSVPVYSV